MKKNYVISNETYNNLIEEREALVAKRNELANQRSLIMSTYASSQLLEDLVNQGLIITARIQKIDYILNHAHIFDSERGTSR